MNADTLQDEPAVDGLDAMEAGEVHPLSELEAETIVRGLESLERIYVAASGSHRDHLLAQILTISHWLTTAAAIACVYETPVEA